MILPRCLRGFIALALGVFGSATTAFAFVTAELSPQGLAYSRVFVRGAEEVSIAVAFPMDWSMRESENQSLPDVACVAMVTGGAGGLPPAYVKEQLADLGGSVSLRARTDEVLTYVSADKQNLNKVLEIASGMLTEPAYRPEWVARARSDLERDFASERQDVSGLARITATWALLGGGSTLRAHVGEASSVLLAITGADLSRWHASVFRRSPSMLIAIAGDIDEAAAGAAVDALLGKLPRAAAVRMAPPPVNFAPRRILLHVPSAPKSVLAFLGVRPQPTSRAEDAIIADVVNDSDGPVFAALRSELSAAYSISLRYLDFGAERRHLVVSGEVETAKLAQAEVAFRAAYGALRQKGLADSLDARKDWISRSYDNDFSTPSDSVDQVVVVNSYGGGAGDTFSSLVARVTNADLSARLLAFPRPEDLLVVAVSPDAKALPGACVITAPEQAASCK